MGPEIIALILLIIFVASLTRATFGFGDALLAMPLLALVIDLPTATPIVALTSNVMAVLILSRSWRSVSVKNAWRLTVASALGVPLGLLLLKAEALHLPLKLTLAFVVAGFAAFKLLKPALFTLKSDHWGWVFGFIAGTLGGAYNTNGPPAVIYGTLRRWSPETFKATLQGYFLPIGLIISAGHGLSGLWTPDVLHTTLLSLPVVLLAFFIGQRLTTRLDPDRFERLILFILIIMGALLAFQTLSKA